MSDGIRAPLRRALEARLDLGFGLAGPWPTLGVEELARRPVRTGSGDDAVLGDFFDLSGTPGATLRFEGDLGLADRLGAGLSVGTVVVDGRVGDDVGIGMSGGAIVVHGDADARAGGAAADARRGMSGGELVIRGSAAEDPGMRMRRGLVVITGDVARRAGPGMIAGTVIVFGTPGPGPGLWSKRGSIVAMGTVEIPPTYRAACTYQPAHLRVTLLGLRRRYGLPVDERYLTGFYRRYSGDLAELGRGEILAWTAA